MATLNSLLFLFSTMAPNMEPPGNSPVTQFPPEWIKSVVPRYGQNVPVLSQTACHLGEHPSCQYHCQKNCSNYDQDIPCPDVCVFGCVCIDPFIRATDGSCIMPFQCPATPDTPVTTETTDESDDIQCQPDEEVNRYAHCQRNCTNVGETIYCPGEGPRGCMCKSPKIRGPDGSCIMSDECPQVQRKPKIPLLSQTACRLGQHPSCQSHCEKNCANYDQDISCPDICVFDCVCIDPLIRGPDGNCIMPFQCPAAPDTPVTSDTTEEPDDVQCQPDEEVSSYAHCQRNCTNVGQVIICPGEGPRSCMCKSPKIRGPDGSCIMSDECSTILRMPQDPDDARNMNCPINEEVSCFSHCQQNCTNYYKKFNCPMYCVTGCVCTPPLIRGPDGSCIMPQQCNKMKAPQRDPDTPCFISQECNDNDDTDEENEINLKALSGPFDNLKVCGDENEIYKLCSSQCEDTCENYYTRRACKLVCLPLPRCECKDGFVRGPNGNCIAVEDCPHREREQLLMDDRCQFVHIHNESICQSWFYWESVAAKTCIDMHMGLYWVVGMLSQCEPELFTGVEFHCCPNSFFREVCPENEEYKDCGTACQKNCDNYDQHIPCGLKCESGCFCKEPLIRGPDGKCIHKEDCPARSNVPTQSIKNSNLGFLPDFPRFSCREYETFSVCASVCPDDCTNYQEDRLCKKICVPGCKCIEGYVKGKDGKCIKKEECDESEETTTKNSNVCHELEDYNDCGSHCERDCYNYDVADHKCEDSSCNPGCFCKTGLVRSPDGRCIPAENCPAPDEKSWSTSFTKKAQLKSDDLLVDERCHFIENLNKSICQGYNHWMEVARQTCLSMNMKPNTIVVVFEPCGVDLFSGVTFVCCPKSFSSENCPVNEEYKECGTACQKNCRDYDRDIPCEFKCESGCFCKEPLIRGPGGKCIYKEDCPARSNIPTQPVKNSNLGFLPDFPRMSCKEYEIFSVCASVCPDDCTNYEEDRLCKKICVPGCKCIEGYVKRKDGKCIKKEDCKEDNSSGNSNICHELEDYNDCGSHCERDCYNYDVTDHKCEDNSCNPGCFCKTGLVRSPDGRCIPADDCPKREKPFWGRTWRS